MARLTYKNGYNKWAFLVVGREITGNAANKLAEYENLGDPSELQRIKRGKWLCACSAESWLYTDEHYKCDKCKKTVERISDFCPNCGADMRSDEERTATNG